MTTFALEKRFFLAGPFIIGVYAGKCPKFYRVIEVTGRYVGIVTVLEPTNGF